MHERVNHLISKYPQDKSVWPRGTVSVAEGRVCPPVVVSMASVCI